VRGLKEQMEGGHKSIESPQRVSVSDLGRIVTGKTPSTKNPAFWGGEYQFVTPSDLEWKTYYCRSTERCVTEEAKQKHTKQFIPSDAVMVTCIGNTIGKCGISATECLTNQQINTIVLHEGIDPKFVYYLIVHNIGLIRGVGVGGGAATPIINKSTFSKIRLKVPSRRTWKTIASILSAYDDLIENNRRRIQLLEQAARLLYKEWFVHLRFPGHEHVKIKDGVPEGWERKRLREIAEIIMGQSPKSKYYNEEGVGLPFHQGVTNFGFRFPTHKTYCTVKVRIAEPGDILLSVRAPVGRINITLDKIVIGRGLSAIRSRCGQQNFLFYSLKNHFFKENIMGRGAIFAAITKKDLHDVEILQPPDTLIEMFQEQVVPIDHQIANLYRMIEHLVKARDLLLPRLMNGEIAV